MTTAAEIIAVLLPRKAAAPLEKLTGLAHSWGVWSLKNHLRHGGIDRGKSDGVVRHFVRNPPPQEPVRPAPGRWRALRALFYQTWDPPAREERGIRRFAAVFSFVLHLAFALFLAILAIVGVHQVPPPEDDASASRVQVEYVGKGTPEQAGGGAPAEAAADAAASAAPAVAGTPTRTAIVIESRQPPAPAAPAPAQPVEARPEAQPHPQPPVAAEPVLAAEPTPTETEFVVPAPRLPVPEVPLPTPRTREPTVPMREIAVVQTPAVQPTVQPRPVDVPELRQPAQQVREREIQAPVEVSRVRAPQIVEPAIAPPVVRRRPAELREREIEAPVEVPDIRPAQVAGAAVATPSLRQPATALREREIPAPKAGSAPAQTATATSTAAATSTTGSAPVAAQEPAAGAQGLAAADASPGPGSANRPGAAKPAPQRGDDWGVSSRNAPGQGEPGTGQKPGLFNEDGSVRVGDDLVGKTTTQPGPPGSRAQQAYDADRANKWLERVQYPYEPTMFDKYWKPRESLLAEWVRKGIKSVEVAIPGTSKKVTCVVSILQLGGGCGLSDPNLNNQPATARPPPEIPVKRNPIPEDS